MKRVIFVKGKCFRQGCKNMKKMETKVKMKEMVYGRFENPEMLYHEDNGDYGIAIINMFGSFPCAYIKFPELNYVPHFDYNLLDIQTDGNIHYGLTFLGTRNEFDLDGLWCGWDYGHAGDYIYVDPIYLSPNIITNVFPEKQWTTKELVLNAKIIMYDILAGRFEIAKDADDNELFL